MNETRQEREDNGEDKANMMLYFAWPEGPPDLQSSSSPAGNSNRFA